MIVSLPGLLSSERCAAFYETLQGLDKWDIGRLRHFKHGYVDPPFQDLQAELKPLAAAKLGQELTAGTIFAHTFWRGAEMPVTRYRRHCWATINILIARDGDEPWPLNFDLPPHQVTFARAIGDAVLHTREHPLWFSPQPGRINATELLLHYGQR
jgi:hypothetical protein